MTTDVLREVYISRGLLAKVSFGVRCAWKSTTPTHVTLEGPPPPPAKPIAVVAVNPELPAIALDGRAQPIPLVDAVLTEAGAPPDFASGAGINLAGAGELIWHIQSAGRVRFAQWQISIMTVDGAEVWRVAGEGRPPVRVPWLTTEEGLPLAPGVEYLYRIAAVSVDGDLGEGRWRRLGVRIGAPKHPPDSAAIATWRGKLFRGTTDEPTRELKKRVAGLVEKLTAGGTEKIAVEVHLAVSRKRSANLLLSQRRAVAIRKLFVDAGYPDAEIRALGRGDAQPVMPNVSRKARELNRRILVKRDLPAHQTGPLAPIAYPACLRIGPHLLEYGRETIEQRVDVEAGDEIVLELREVNGRRVRLARTYPFGSAATEGQRSVDLAVTGTLVPPTLRLGDDPIALPLLDSSCEMASEPPTVSGQGLTPPARFAIETEAPIRSWLVRVLNPEGTVLRDLTGDGDPPEAVEWDGKNAAGAVVVRQGDYVFRCLLTDVDGNRVVSPKRPLPIGVATGPSYERVLDQGLYPESGKLEGPLAEELNRIVAAVEANPGARVRVEVHDVADGGKMQAQIRTARLAAKLKASLAEAGIPEEALEVVALGASRPIMAGSTRRARGANRRVVIQIHAPDAGRGPVGEHVPPERHVRLAGVEMDVADDGSFSGTIVVEQDATLVADVAVGDGRTAIYHMPMFDGRPMDARASTLPQAFRPSLGEEPIGSKPATLMQTPAPPPPAPSSVRASIVGGGLVDAVAGWSPRMPASRVALPSGPIALHEPEGPPRERPVEMAQAMPSGAQPVTLPIAEAPPTAAADLHAWLPDEGAELAGGRLTVRGRANDRNVVKVNGEVVALDDLGGFVHTVELPAGDAKLEITSEDEDGNVARIDRKLRVPAGEWFLLALGDGVAGWGGKLEGMNDDTTIDFKSETYLHGRAAVYFKGSLDGSALFGASPFEKLRLTGHLDTGKEPDSDLVKQLIDPEAYYPAYGDTAEEVQDVSSRSKGYLRLEADRSRLTVGNFETQIDGLELFRFHRTYFGGSLDVDHPFLEESPTEVHAFYASGEAGVRHRQLIFQGTGGSMFFLRDADLLEGSERVELVVRDAVTGSRLMTVRQVRNVDYTVDYRDGRLVFAQPIPSTATSGWRLDQNPVGALDGHSVFIEVEYDYNAAIPEDGETAFAAQVRQTLFDTVTIGGGYVDEDKRDAGGPRYQLFGGELRVKALEETRLDIEVAYSKAQDAEHFISYDGGVSYADTGSAGRFQDGDGGDRIPEDAEGWAAKLRLSGDIGEIAGRPAWVGSDEGGRPGRFLPYTLTMHHQDSGFFSGSSVLEQGQTKVSGQIRAVLTDVDSVRLRHDGVWSRLFIGGNEQMVNRQMSFLGYEREAQSWKAGLEVGHTYWDDSQRVVNTDSVTAYGDARLTDRLTLTGEQEAILRGDDRVLSGIGDQLVTTAGAKYQIAERLWLTASESVRWSGTNATQIGLKTKLSDDISLYANERLTAGNGRQVSTTVLGGESTAIPGSRSYAEYQLSSMASGRSGRAVFGMDNRWVLSEGLKLSLAYERSQLVGRPNGSLGTSLGAGTAVADPRTTGYGSGPLNRDQQFSASGYSSGGVFPVGVSSRDAFSVGLELLRMTTLKAGVRFEIRYDRGDADLGADDRLVLSGQAGGDWRFDRRLVLLGRLRGASVHNLTFREDAGSALGFTEGQYMDVSLGLAYRPVHSDTFEALVKWTRRYNRKPVTADLSQYQLEIADVISAEPVVEFGYGVQAVGKVAVKAFEVQDADLPRIRSSMLLGLLRLNYHLTEMFDVGAEYRWLGNFLTDEEEHGTLVEVAWIPVRYVSVGVGYNFTHFSDDLLADPTTDNHGAFLRVSGRY
jgi:outer membrane protein OmpA-like peptidoglycan-associated protein